MNKNIIITLIVLIVTNVSLKAQWAGPTSGVLNTQNTVVIAKNGNSVCLPGPCAPLFEAQLFGFPTTGGGAVPGGIKYAFHIA